MISREDNSHDFAGEIVGRLPSRAIALGLGLYVLAGSSARAQDSGAVYGAAARLRAVPLISFRGMGVPGLTLTISGWAIPSTRGHGMGHHHPHGYVLRQLSLRNWCSDVLGKEDLCPYYANPYGPPPMGFGYPAVYAAPTRNAANTAAGTR